MSWEEELLTKEVFHRGNFCITENKQLGKIGLVILLEAMFVKDKKRRVFIPISPSDARSLAAELIKSADIIEGPK